MANAVTSPVIFISSSSSSSLDGVQVVEDSSSVVTSTSRILSPRYSSSSCPSISNVEKVTNWMNDNNLLGLRPFRVHEEEQVVNVLSDLEDRSNSSSPTNSNVLLVHYDFNKKTRNEVKEVPSSSNNNNGLFTAKQLLVRKRTSSPPLFLNGSSKKKPSSRSLSTSSKNSLDTPLSPESQKKKELCSYLQLMNPADKKQIFLNPNRRSTRVKNLTLKLEEEEKRRKRLEDEKTLKRDERKTSFDDNFDNNRKKLKLLERKTSLDDRNGFSTKSNVEELSRSKSLRLLPSKTRTPPPQVLKTSSVKTKTPPPKVKTPPLKLKSKPETPPPTPPTTITQKPSKYKVYKPIIKKSILRRRIGNKVINRYKIIPKLSSLRSSGTLKHVGIKNLLMNRNLVTKKQKKLMRKVFEKRIVNKPVEKEEAQEDKPSTPLPPPEPIKKLTVEIFELGGDITNENADDYCYELLSNEHKQFLLGETSFEEESVELPEPEMISHHAPESTISLDHSYLSEVPKINHAPEVVTPAEEPIEPVTSSLDHDYVTCEEITPCNSDEEEEPGESSRSPTPSLDLVTTKLSEYKPFEHKPSEVKSLHKSLTFQKPKPYLTIDLDTANWDLDSSSAKPKNDKPKLSHSITISKSNGAVLFASYLDFHLVICQESLVSFWTQSALGNVLGSQDMWIPKGQAQRLDLTNRCVQKQSREMVMAMENSVAYVELWTKEHKSELRERPVADVFVTVYFWMQRQSGLGRKVIQLENINGFADDVQYVVLNYSPKIVVSWHSVTEPKNTRIHIFQLAADFQTVSNIYEIQAVNHYLASLHNIEDCPSLLMGCGEDKVTVWNIEYAYLVATIELLNIKSSLSTFWAKCDRGFLFTLQQCVDGELRLIAINGMNHTWKKLASYTPSVGFDRLRGVCIDNGILISFYDKGIICWNAETAEPVIEDLQESECIPSGKHVIMIVNDEIIVRHAITHLISPDDP